MQKKITFLREKHSASEFLPIEQIDTYFWKFSTSEIIQSKIWITNSTSKHQVLNNFIERSPSLLVFYGVILLD